MKGRQGRAESRGRRRSARRPRATSSGEGVGEPTARGGWTVSLSGVAWGQQGRCTKAEGQAAQAASARAAPNPISICLRDNLPPSLREALLPEHAPGRDPSTQGAEGACNTSAAPMVPTPPQQQQRTAPPMPLARRRRRRRRQCSAPAPGVPLWGGALPAAGRRLPGGRAAATAGQQRQPGRRAAVAPPAARC